MTVARTFAGWALALTPGDVPPRVVRAACRHLLDGTGVAIAAARLDAVPAAIAVASRLHSPAEATVVGTGARLPAPAAAFANGALVHALDYDDTHADALVHATAAVLPAAFAAGEETGSTGAEVVAACVAGYEIVARLGAAVVHGFHNRGFHATSVCGVFSAALIAAKLMRLSVTETVNALGIAGSLASGSLEFLHAGSATKTLHPGFAGTAGLTAARLAAAGADGPDTIFEGEAGLYRSFTGSTVDPRTLTASLGERWETERITVKPFPACQLSHASLDALRIAVDGGVDPARIAEIVFEIPPETAAIVCEPLADKRRPRTAYEGKFSLPYCGAVLILDGELGVGAFGTANLEREDVAALASRAAYRTRDFGGPPATAPGIAEVHLAGGRVVRAEVEHSRGGPGAPLSDDELLAKFVANCGGAAAGAKALAEALLDLANVADVSSVLEATTPFGSPEVVR